MPTHPLSSFVSPEMYSPTSYLLPLPASTSHHSSHLLHCLGDGDMKASAGDHPHWWTRIIGFTASSEGMIWYLRIGGRGWWNYHLPYRSHPTLENMLWYRTPESWPRSEKWSGGDIIECICLMYLVPVSVCLIIISAIGINWLYLALPARLRKSILHR